MNYAIHDILNVRTDVDIAIPSYFESDYTSTDIHIQEYPGEALHVDGGKRCGAFRYKVTDKSLLVEYDVPFRTVSFEIVNLTSFMYNPAFAKYGDVRKIARTLYDLACIRKGWPLVHAGALEHDGSGILVTAPPDSGKTSTVLDLIDSDYWRFLGDDHVFLGRDGTIKSNPRPVNLSPFTLTGPIDRSNGLAWKAKRRLARSDFEILGSMLGIEMGERRDVPRHLLDDETSLNTAVVLGSGEPGVERINASTAAQQIVTSTMDEFDPFGHYSLVLYAHEFDVDLTEYVESLKGTVKVAVKGTDCYRVTSNDVADYPELIREEVL